MEPLEPLNQESMIALIEKNRKNLDTKDPFGQIEVSKTLGSVRTKFQCNEVESRYIDIPSTFLICIQKGETHVLEL